MNHYIRSQIENMKMITKAFQQGCQLAAMQNDGQVDKEEAKVMKKIDAAAQKFIKELDSILK